MTLIIIIITILLLLSIYYFISFIRRRRRMRFYIRNIPNPPPLPIIGNVLDFVGSTGEF